jgi:hypothetical protein
MKICTTILICVLIMLAVRVNPLFSFDREREFEFIGKMNIRELTPRAVTALEKKYPGEKWETYNFPKYVYISEAVLTGYKIAVKYPQLLAKFPCYCFCEQTMNHRDLAYCFLKTGTFMGNYDNHGSICNICIGEAMMALLWNELGAPLTKIQAAVKAIFKPGG